LQLLDSKVSKVDREGV